MSEVKRRTILHHSGELTQELRHFLITNGYYIQDITVETNDLPGFILVAGEENIENVAKAYNTVEKDVRLISLSSIKNLQSFIGVNGRLILDPNTVAAPSTKLALERFFLNNSSVYLDENYPEVKDFFNFKVTNHLRVGHELDRMSLYAFEKNFNIVNIRGYVDSVIFYLYYLKQSGVACIPFECDYGANEEDFIVQIHLFVKNYVADYLIDSFGTPQSQDPLRYILSQCTYMSDFFEIQYIENVSKLVITGLWKNKEAQNRGFNGMMIHQVMTSSQIDKKIKLNLLSNWESQSGEVDGRLDRLKDKLLPGHFFEILFPENYQGYFKIRPELAKILEEFIQENFKPDRNNPDITEIELNKVKEIINTHPDQEEMHKLHHVDFEHLQQRLQKRHILSAMNEEAEKVRRSLEDNDAFADQLKSRYTDEVTKKIVGNLDDKVVENILNKIETSTDEQNPMLADYLDDDEGFLRHSKDGVDRPIIVKGSKNEEELITRVMGSAQEEIKNIIVQGERLSKGEMFQRLSEVIKPSLKGSDVEKESFLKNIFFNDFSGELDKFLAENNKTEEEITNLDYQDFVQENLAKLIKQRTSHDENLKLTEEDFNNSSTLMFKRLFNNNLREKINELKMQGRKLTSEQSKELIKNVLQHSLAVAFKIGNFKSQYAKDRHELAKTIKNILQDPENLDIINIIQVAQKNIQVNEDTEVERILKEGFDDAEMIDEKQVMLSGDPIQGALYKKLRNNEHENKKLQTMIDALKTELMVMKESNEMLRNTNHSNILDQNNLRIDTNGLDVAKLHHDFQTKEQLYIKEIEKAQRLIHARDHVIEKAKESFRVESETKDKEIRELNKKLITLVRIEAMDNRQNVDSRILDLSNENINLIRQVEVYKNKFTALASNFEPQAAKKEITIQNDDKTKNVGVENQHLQEQLINFKKEMATLSERALEDKEFIELLKKKADGVPQSEEHYAKELKKAQLELKESFFKISKYQSNITELENKVVELSTVLAKAGGGKTEAGIEKAKVAQLEKLMAKMTSDFKAREGQLIETKKEVQKYKADRTALMNELEKARREIERFKALAPKKPPGGKVA